MMDFISKHLISPFVELLFPVTMQTHIIFTLETLVKIAAILIPVLITVAYITYAERRIIGFIQVRQGPNRVGFFGHSLWGLGQPLADAVKLIPF